ncbi:hypothetical protein HHK36_011729 [Tetracentron sinense]|uniref:Gnk2-homologous domain-containing protein n=1 Tax=Tetracentron sinense TaxID=13715 RepID=A0A834ZAZ7_TETSI|nr:hypothetical protein HHK36_011729 [Tetracentron sinense]
MPSTMRSFELLFLFSALLTHSTAQPTYLKHHCSLSNSSKAFETNLNLLLSSLTSKVITMDGEFYSNKVGKNPDRVEGQFLCRGDVTPEVCQNCVKKASERVSQGCPNQTGAVTWFDECMLHYSNIRFLGIIEMLPDFIMYNMLNNSQPDEPDIHGIHLITGLILKAQGLPLMYATEESQVTESETIYGLVQCTRDLSSADCGTCLGQLMTPNFRDWCEGKRGCRLLAPSCIMRYEYYLFYKPTLQPMVPEPAPQTEPSTPGTTKANKKRTAIIATVAAILAAILLGSCIYYLRARKKMQQGQLSWKRFQARGSTEPEPHRVSSPQSLLPNLPTSAYESSGYMAPEYAMEGVFSVKSDVFSFGVLLLEIIAGKRNNGFYLTEQGQSLLIYKLEWASCAFGLGLRHDLNLDHGVASGYMALEYAMEGVFSVKSDVFSFGVLLLEIITGKRNNGFYLTEQGQSLLIYEKFDIEPFVEKFILASLEHKYRDWKSKLRWENVTLGATPE